MNPLRCVTLSVADIERAKARYTTFLDYRIVDESRLDDATAASWDASDLAGHRQAVLRAASGVAADLRFVETPPYRGYHALRTHGWSAVELCIEDVHATHARLAGSPFEIIGPPSAVAGLPTIHPMQVLGPDDEVVYLTQILDRGATSGLPVAKAAIDRPFIVVLACADLERTMRWCIEQFGVRVDQDLSIPYRMLNRAFDLPDGTLHRLVTLEQGRDIFLEIDQYPSQATGRPRQPDRLPPGIASCTLMHADLASIPGPWLAKPVERDGPVYQGRRVGTLHSPEGALFEVVEEEVSE